MVSELDFDDLYEDAAQNDRYGPCDLCCYNEEPCGGDHLLCWCGACRYCHSDIFHEDNPDACELEDSLYFQFIQAVIQEWLEKGVQHHGLGSQSID